MEMDIYFMREALREAEKARLKQEVPVGAVLVREGRIVARGHNLRESRGNPLAHAEILVLEKAARRLGGWRLEETTLYVTLEPCLMCVGALVAARVRRLVYGASDPKVGAVRSLLPAAALPGLNHRIEVVGGILEEECRRILKDFFRERRRRDG